ncbi:MAG TPA: hypothetical protein VFO25_10470 [Candidatus Eremiobacteraceae bacterium]|nr:hypothetical protein [Candidatus Eremiobacteraceae bacterium]
MKTVVRWIGAVIGLLVFVLIVAIAIGTGLPIAHIASCSAQYRQSPATLFATVEDDASSPSWRSDVREVHSETATVGRTRWVETYKNGQTLTYLEFGDRNISGKYLERDIADPTLPFGGGWKYRFDPSGGGTVVTIREAGWIYNPMFRFVEQFFTGYTSTIKTYLTDLGRKYGESPAITCTVTTYANRPEDM